MKTILKAALLGAAATAVFAVTPAMAAGGVCLITKNNTNPFFVKMKEGAEAKATELGLEFQAFAGKVDGDAGPQIEAIENCVASGAKGILITASNDFGHSRPQGRALQGRSGDRARHPDR